MPVMIAEEAKMIKLLIPSRVRAVRPLKKPPLVSIATVYDANVG
jgi:hypothetical protein